MMKNSKTHAPEYVNPNVNCLHLPISTADEINYMNDKQKKQRAFFYGINPPKYIKHMP